MPHSTPQCRVHLAPHAATDGALEAWRGALERACPGRVASLEDDAELQGALVVGLNPKDASLLEALQARANASVLTVDPTSPPPPAAVVAHARTASALGESRRREALALDELSAFMTSVSHDMKGPLQGVVGLAGLLLELEGDLLSDEGREILGRIELSGDHLGQLFDVLLVHSRLGRKPGRIMDTPLGELVDQALAEVRRRFADVTLDALVAGDRAGWPTLRLDRDAAQLAVTHLLDNAVRYADGATRSVTVQVAATEGGGAAITIRDRGRGLPADLHDRVFGMFVRHEGRAYEQTGAGLALARRAARVHGGDVTLASTPGEGTAVTMTLRDLPR